jgi:rod shape determining protein RodA
MRLLSARIDLWLITPVIILIGLGLVTIYSLTPESFPNQLFAVIMASIAFLFFSQLNPSALKAFSFPIYVAALIILGVVLLIGIESRGAVRWVNILGITVQFSEVFKPFLAISFANFLAHQSNTSPRTFIKVIAFLIPIFLLIDLQPDLGNALIYAGVVFLVMMFFGFPLKWFFLSALPLVLSLPLLWARLHEYQKQRILTFFTPTSDPLGTSYNVIQAIIAVGSGQLIGKGFSQGSQSNLQFLPERHTDFIFASLTEGLGFVGGVIVIGCFAVLGYKLYSMCRDSDDMFSKVYVACAFFLIMIHFFVNIGMNIGIVPIVGVTLPFVSFGGSSLLSNAILLGIVSAIVRSERKKNVLEIR